MTKSVGSCLLNYNPDSYQKELAVNFVKEYFNSPRRGYGGGVIEVFQTLKRDKFQDVLGPARYQFNGSGSFGNGAAMRISPVALFCLNKSEDFMLDLVKKTSEITHANVIGINGAVLQALAVQQCLNLDPKVSMKVNDYVGELLEKFKKVETGEDE